jgi:pyruvate dehydrogenase E1 component beta subunit
MSQEVTYVQALNLALKESMREDPKTFVMGEDVAHYGGMFRVTEGLLGEFGPKRVIDTPISESAFVGMALGAALKGLKPIVELMFVDFSLVAMDQLLNQIAKTTLMSGGKVSVPLVIRTQGGGYKGAAAQHSQMLEALLLHVPGLKVVAPAHPSEAYHLLKAAIKDPNPVFFLENKQLYGSKGIISADFSGMEKARVVRRGSRLTLLTYSYSLTLAEEAVKDLDVDLIDLRTLNPLDWETIAESISRTHRCLIVHESHKRCGVGVDLASRIQEELFDELDAPVKVLGALDCPIPFAKSLEDVVLPTVQSIRAAALEVLA